MERRGHAGRLESRAAAGLALALMAPFAVMACKRDEPKPMPPQPPIALSKADPAAKTIDFDVASDGKTSIDMPAPKERIKADTTAAKGKLQVDLANLANTRGDVFIDLTTLTTHTFTDPEKNASQTHHARTWLQVDDMVKDSAVRERNRWVHFAIRSIDGLSATDATKVAPVKEGGDDVRVVTMTAHGDLEVHSLPAAKPKDVALEVRLHVPAGSPPDAKPSLVEVKSKAPFQIVLADHDIKPRDTEGILAQEAFDLLGTKVADVANVSVDLRGVPAQ